MKAILSAIFLLSCLCSYSAPAKHWNRNSIIEDIHVRAAGGDLVMVAGVEEYFVFVQGNFPMDRVSVYLELWEPDGSLRSKAQIFAGDINKSEVKCGTIYIGNLAMPGAVICVEKLVDESASGGPTHITTSYSLRKLLMAQKQPANQAPEPTPTTVTPPAGQEARQP